MHTHTHTPLGQAGAQMVLQRADRGDGEMPGLAERWWDGGRKREKEIQSEAATDSLPVQKASEQSASEGHNRHLSENWN